jgi:hypothetical protein
MHQLAQVASEFLPSWRAAARPNQNIGIVMACLTVNTLVNVKSLSAFSIVLETVKHGSGFANLADRFAADIAKQHWRVYLAANLDFDHLVIALCTACIKSHPPLYSGWGIGSPG